MRGTRIALIIVAVVCFGVALSYPIRYRLAQQSNEADMEQLSALREQALEADGTADAPTAVDTATAAHAGEAEPTAKADEATAPPIPDEVTPEAAVEVAVEATTPPETAPPEAAATEEPTRDQPVEAAQTTAPAEAPREAEAVAGSVEEAIARARAAVTSEATEADPAEAPVKAEETVGEGVSTQKEASGEVGQTEAAQPAPTPAPTPTPGIMDLILDYEPQPTLVPIDFGPTRAPDPGGTPTPAATFDVEGYTGALPYSLKEKVTLDEDAILPELREIYAINGDLVGWLTIPDTVIDYPVVQTEDSEFYLTHDFYGRENQNGQIILDTLCDPYTPSYNLVISGHHMKNGSMFGDLPLYASAAYWEAHRFLEFDTLMARKRYVVFAAFYSADYDEDEEGFRYNVNVRYRMDADPWLAEIRENQLYDTGIDVKFGDEFITLTTCNRARHRNGRFVVVCRKIREGETFE